MSPVIDTELREAFLDHPQPGTSLPTTGGAGVRAPKVVQPALWKARRHSETLNFREMMLGCKDLSSL